MVKEIKTKQEFDEIISQSKLVVVDFTATWYVCAASGIKRRRSLRCRPFLEQNAMQSPHFARVPARR